MKGETIGAGDAQHREGADTDARVYPEALGQQLDCCREVPVL
jgi:hypothetical protein